MDAKHYYRVGSHEGSFEALPSSDELDKHIASARRHIEPWLSAVFQAEHLNLLIGSGFSTGLAYLAGATPAGMSTITLGTTYDKSINDHAAASAKKMKRGGPNIEDQLRSALAVLEGLSVIDPEKAVSLSTEIGREMKLFLQSLLIAEKGIKEGSNELKRSISENILQSFLLSFASRSASRERLHIFTTNYDRVIEHGCDLAGLRTIDRFVGSLNPVFRSSRVDVDMHYNPPGIRGEPRFMEGVIRLTKLHGSLDWHYNKAVQKIVRKGIPFGADASHTDMAVDPVDTVMIYPNPAKDVETTQYPYAELFRDYAASLCRPNAVLVTYGYGFGDDHINRVILDMLTIPSTHLVIIAFEIDERIKSFCRNTLSSQVSILGGSHFGDIKTLVENYLPKPALDYITGRMTDLLRNRPNDLPSEESKIDASPVSPLNIVSPFDITPINEEPKNEEYEELDEPPSRVFEWEDDVDEDEDEEEDEEVEEDEEDEEDEEVDPLS